jgi:hypothetical protein
MSLPQDLAALLSDMHYRRQTMAAMRGSAEKSSAEKPMRRFGKSQSA